MLQQIRKDPKIGQQGTKVRWIGAVAHLIPYTAAVRNIDGQCKLHARIIWFNRSQNVYLHRFGMSFDEKLLLLKNIVNPNLGNWQQTTKRLARLVFGLRKNLLHVLQKHFIVWFLICSALSLRGKVNFFYFPLWFTTHNQEERNHPHTGEQEQDWLSAKTYWSWTETHIWFHWYRVWKRSKP